LEISWNQVPFTGMVSTSSQHSHSEKGTFKQGVHTVKGPGPHNSDAMGRHVCEGGNDVIFGVEGS
jgi:hypothetical protein